MSSNDNSNINKMKKIKAPKIGAENQIVLKINYALKNDINYISWNDLNLLRKKFIHDEFLYDYIEEAIIFTKTTISNYQEEDRKAKEKSKNMAAHVQEMMGNKLKPGKQK